MTAHLAVWNAVDPDVDLLVTGEMGIGNTTSAAVIARAFSGGSGQYWVGHGTGIGDEGLRRKAAVVDQGVALHANAWAPESCAALVGAR